MHSRMDKPLRSAYDSHMAAEHDRGEAPREWLAEFEAAARRPLPVRWRYAFIRTYKPVLDDAPFRSFASTREYRQWCNENLPEWLGYASF